MNDWARLREEPGLDAPELARLPVDAAVVAWIGSQVWRDGIWWAPVRLGEQTCGAVAAQFLSTSGFRYDLGLAALSFVLPSPDWNVFSRDYGAEIWPTNDLLWGRISVLNGRTIASFLEGREAAGARNIAEFESISIPGSDRAILAGPLLNDDGFWGPWALIEVDGSLIRISLHTQIRNPDSTDGNWLPEFLQTFSIDRASFVQRRIPVDGTPVDPPSPQATVMEAVEAWRSGDWDRLARVASADSVAMAQQIYRPEHEGPSFRGNFLHESWACSAGGDSCGFGSSFCGSGGAQCSTEIQYWFEPDAAVSVRPFALSLELIGDEFIITSLGTPG